MRALQHLLRLFDPSEHGPATACRCPLAGHSEPVPKRRMRSAIYLLIPQRAQSAILGMHSINQRAAVINGQIVARPMMNIALTYDHRCICYSSALCSTVCSSLCSCTCVHHDPQRLQHCSWMGLDLSSARLPGTAVR